MCKPVKLNNQIWECTSMGADSKNNFVQTVYNIIFASYAFVLSWF